MRQRAYPSCELVPEAVERSASRSATAAFPARAELERMRGIGPYTASAVLAIVYGQAEPLVDVNMTRLLGRFFGSSGDTRGSRQRLLHALGLRLVSGGHSLQVNWAVLDFGALVCRARRPLCPECPLRVKCQSFM